eukprot:3244160-Pleurochrysis_carterae.AAC.1
MRQTAVVFFCSYAPQASPAHAATRASSRAAHAHVKPHRTAHEHAKLHLLATLHRTRTPSRPAHARPLGVRHVRRPNHAQHGHAPQGAERADAAIVGLWSVGVWSAVFGRLEPTAVLYKMFCFQLG